jgi:hypothetical protein
MLSDSSTIDLLPAGGLFAKLRDIHVAEISEYQRARDRRRGEHQEIDRLALARQSETLMHAEAVLLIDHGQREIVEGDVVLKQSVRADDEIDLAGGQRRQNLRSFAPALAAGEDGEADTCGGCERRDGGKMLACQKLGRRHECRLAACFDHGRGGEQSHDRLAGANVAVQQPQHPVGLRKICDNVGDRALLRGCQRVGQRGDHSSAQKSLGGAAAARSFAHMTAQQRERELARKQFVIGQSRPGRALRLKV